MVISYRLGVGSTMRPPLVIHSPDPSYQNERKRLAINPSFRFPGAERPNIRITSAGLNHLSNGNPDIYSHPNGLGLASPDPVRAQTTRLSPHG